MKPGEYKQRDILPLTLILLKNMEAIYLASSLKYALMFHYPDLHSMIDLRNLDQATIDICYAAEHPVCKILFDMAAHYSGGVAHLANSRSICVQKLMHNRRLMRLAFEFLDIFCTGDWADDSDCTGLEMRAFEIARAMHCVCELMVHGKTDLSKEALSHNYKYMLGGAWTNYFAEERDDIRIVAMLTEKSCQSCLSLMVALSS